MFPVPAYGEIEVNPEVTDTVLCSTVSVTSMLHLELNLADSYCDKCASNLQRKFGRSSCTLIRFRCQLSRAPLTVDSIRRMLYRTARNLLREKLCFVICCSN